jgi:hypothetical protein
MANEMTQLPPTGRQSELRKSETRQLQREPVSYSSSKLNDDDLNDSNDLDESTSSILKDYQNRRNRISNSAKKFEKYKSYSDQITKLTSKYNRQLSPDSDIESKRSEMIEKNISLGPEKSETPTPDNTDEKS